MSKRQIQHMPKRPKGGSRKRPIAVPIEEQVRIAVKEALNKKYRKDAAK